MRRIRPLMALLTILCLMLTLAPVASAERQNLDAANLLKAGVEIDGQILDAEGYIVEGRTMVPLRKIFETMGATIEWDAATWTVTATKGQKVIKLTVGEPTAVVDGRSVTLAVPPVLVNSRTFVPLRFVAEAFGAEVSWDQPNIKAVIKTGGNCNLAPFQVHEGTIANGGETWGRCGSPHIVKNTFLVEGKDSPILSIQEGAVVQFEQNARIEVGHNAPGGLKVYGTEKEPIVFTAATSGPQPGFWNGIRFYNQTLVNDTIIDNARIEYAGENGSAAVLVEGWQKTVEIVMKNVEIKHSLWAGLQLNYQGKLKAGSANLKINGTTVGENGGFPIVTDIIGSHNLPRGEFKNNAVNAVHVWEQGQGHATVASNTTWRNVSIPYAISPNIYVEGNSAPTLTIEPGVITLWESNAALMVGKSAAGHLVADAVARPEGGGEWYTRPEGGGEWKVGKAELDLGVQLANASALEPGCALCGKNRAIVFGAWNASPDRGAWGGVQLYPKAGDKTKLNGAVIAWGGKDSDFSAGLYAEGSDQAIKFTLSNSMIYGAFRSGMEFYGNAQIKPESTGNYFVNNGWPLRMTPNLIGYMPAGQTFTENTKQVVSISTTGGSSDDVTRSATWRNQGIPYKFELSVYIAGTASPVVTIEPGTVLLFDRDTNLNVGSQSGTGSLVAVGAAGKPITFTTELKRAGGWEGLHFAAEAGAGNKLEYVVIEYANVAVSVNDDLGGFIKNTTIRNSKEKAIYRNYGTEGTSFVTGLGNQFEGNAMDEE